MIRADLDREAAKGEAVCFFTLHFMIEFLIKTFFIGAITSDFAMQRFDDVDNRQVPFAFVNTLSTFV